MTSKAAFTGTISFDAWGNPAKAVVINEIAKGQPQLLKTICPR